ncbi:Mov34/MPN/PAD-1 family protein [Methylobacterium sp. M6A4_1b]
MEEVIAGYVTEREIGLEAGGLLIGNYRGPHLEVGHCTTPLPGDHRGRYLFDRRDAGHQAEALNAWRRSGGTDTFVGEWHTYPVDHPTPSGRNFRTWHAIMQRTSNLVLFLIAGRRSLWCGLGRTGELQRLKVISAS